MIVLALAWSLLLLGAVGAVLAATWVVSLAVVGFRARRARAQWVGR